MENSGKFRRCRENNNNNNKETIYKYRADTENIMSNFFITFLKEQLEKLVFVFNLGLKNVLIKCF